jgi:hypothetical protein
MKGGNYIRFWGKVKEKSTGAAGGRNEETYCGHAEGIPEEQNPSRRQQKQFKSRSAKVKIEKPLYNDKINRKKMAEVNPTPLKSYAGSVLRWPIGRFYEI